MATVDIKYDKVSDAAKRARKVAKKMYDYSDQLPKKVNTPLHSVTGGMNGNLNTVASAINSKAAALDSRGDAYGALATSLSTFVANAKTADKNVHTAIKALADFRAQNLNIFQKAARGAYNWFNDKLGNTKFGKFVNETVAVVQTYNDFKRECIKKVYNYFAHGNGRYVLNTLKSCLKLAAAVLGVVLAAILVIAASPASWLLIGALVLSAFACLVTLGDTVAAVSENAKAFVMGTFGDDPGRARWYGDTSDMKGAAKKESTNRGVQNFFKNLDFAGKVAGFVSGLLTLGAGGSNAVFSLDYSSTTMTLEGADRLNDLHEIYDAVKTGKDFIGMGNDGISLFNDFVDFNNTGDFSLQDVAFDVFDFADDVFGFEGIGETIGDIKGYFEMGDSTLKQFTGSDLKGYINDFMFSGNDGNGFNANVGSHYMQFAL